MINYHVSGETSQKVVDPRPNPPLFILTVRRHPRVERHG